MAKENQSVGTPKARTTKVLHRLLRKIKSSLFWRLKESAAEMGVASDIKRAQVRRRR